MLTVFAVLFVFSNTVLSQIQIDVNLYNIYNVVSFDGSNLTNTSSGCIVIGFDVHLRCLNGSGKLVDGDIGPINSISGNLGEFFAFSRYSVDGIGRITFNFEKAATVSRAVIYFFNSPNDSIGLPMISLYGEGGQPFIYVFDNNDDLRQSDSQLRNVTLNIQQLTDVVQLDFNFNTSIIDWLLVSEVNFYNGNPISPSLYTIVFQDGPSLTVTLGPDNLQSSVNLSCTVVNASSFEWQWQYNEDVLNFPGRSQILIGDATRTSILTINQLRYTDAGNYTCIVKHSLETVNYTRYINLELTVNITVVSNNMVSVNIGDNVTLSCEVYGYLPPNVTIIWNYINGVINNGEHYKITTNTGSLMAIDFNGNNTNSIVSNLTIYNINGSDVGTYNCMILGTSLQATINLYVIRITTSISTLSIETTPTSSSTPTTDVSPTTDIPVSPIIVILIAVAIVVLLMLLVLVAVVLSCLIKHYKKKQRYDTHVLQETEHKNKQAADINVNDQVYAVVMKDKAPELPPAYLLSEDTTDPTKDPNQQEEDHILNNSLYVKKDEATAIYSLANHIYDEAQDVTLQIPEVYDSVIDMTEFNIATDEVEYHIPIKLRHTKRNENIFVTDDTDDMGYAIPTKFRHITQENLKEIKQLGIGQFGEVILAETIGLSLKDLRMSPSDDDKSISVQVAVKKMKEDSDPKSWEAFHKEVKFMSQLNHVSVIHLLAVSHSSCTEHFIVMEYMENGDLNQFLLNHYFSKQHPPPSTDQLSPQILLSMCIQIANGMTYLASNNYIHRDLASRNCLVGQNYVVKIGNFGLSRELYDSAYYCTKGKAKVPIRWMPTECYYGKFSEKSDVWAYGVTVWEIYTMGREQPYTLLSDQDVVEDALKGPHRTLLSKPSYCPQEVYDIIHQHCWSSNSKERAPFVKLYQLLVEVQDKDYI